MFLLHVMLSTEESISESKARSNKLGIHPTLARWGSKTGKFQPRHLSKYLLLVTEVEMIIDAMKNKIKGKVTVSP